WQTHRLEDEGMVWDSKRGWSIPRQTLDSIPFLFGFYCLATLQGIEYRSILYLVHSTGSQVYDVKLYPEDSVELITGEALTLNCTATVEFDTPVEFQWSYPGKQMNSTVGIVHKRNSLPRFTEAVSILTIQSVNKPFISLDYRSGPVIEATLGQKSLKLLVKRHALEIRDVHPEDAGNYTVLLKNTAALLERRLTITLIIHEKEIAAPSNPYRHGSRQTLTCTGYGRPAPNITWQWRAWSPCGLNSTPR
ncbi:unnamed protein product, partial [Coregonus sp. 'balchen']